MGKIIVYLTTNKISGKKYIGSHEIISSNDNYLGSGKLILKALKKYGADNFERKILGECSSKKEAYLLEEKYISQYNTLSPYGYNISPKGGHRAKNSLSNETKKKISQSISGENHPNFGKPSWMKGKKHSEESKLKMSKSKKGKATWNKGIKMKEESKEKLRMSLSGELHPNFGKHLSDETKKKIGKAHKGKKVSNETKKKMSDSHKGQIPWNKGIKLKNN